MSLEGFMSEIHGFRKVDVTKREIDYLFYLILGHNTAYKVFSHLRKQKPIAYKNVHERIKRLYDFKLIRQLDIKGKRGAITYELTSMGLVVILEHVPILSSFLVTYRTNIILQYLLFRFFEPKTIEYFDSIHASKLLLEYFSKTTSEILSRLEEVRSSKRNDKNRILSKEIESIVKKNITNFIHTIVTSNYERVRVVFRDEGKNVGEFEYDIQGLPPEGMNEISNFTAFFPVKSLKKDQKFMYFLKEIKKEFDEGYRKFME